MKNKHFKFKFFETKILIEEDLRTRVIFERSTLETLCITNLRDALFIQQKHL
jgi:hypothetical protein